MLTSTFVGVAAGLGVATLQSFSYLFSREFLRRDFGGILSLLIYSHIFMGLASAVVLVVVAPGWGILRPEVIKPVLAAAGFYALGQVGFFWALSRVASSRLAPLLGLKIVVLALIVVLWQHSPISGMQWVAVVLSVAAAFLLNEAGGRIPWRGLAGLIVGVLGYSVSDINCKIIVGIFESRGRSGALTGVALTYLACGIAGVLFLPLAKKGSQRAWLGALPYAAFWFLAMVLLFECFLRIGVVFGNIVQSMRGLISIGLGVWVASMGWTHIESHMPRRVFWKRVTAALLMLGAVALYSCSP